MYVYHNVQRFTGLVQKRVLDPLELELQMGVSHHVGAGNWTEVLYKSSQCSELLNQLFSPLLYIFTSIHLDI